MRKLINNIKTKELIDKYSVEDWNATVKKHFTPFFQNEAIVDKNIELLRTEIVNLSFIFQHQEYIDLLSWTLNIYRAQIGKDKNNFIKFLVKVFPNIERANAAWMSLFQTRGLTDENCFLYDSAYQTFSDIDAILEGCYKPLFQILYGIVVKSESGSYPSCKKRIDFGEMRSKFPPKFQTVAKLYLEDPKTNLSINQWRNIAAHKTFAVKSDTEIELQYGIKRPYKIHIISPGILREILSWVINVYNTLRLANVIICFEYMEDIQPLLSEKPNIRLDQWLTGLCHNLSIVGFPCIATEESNETYILVLQNHYKKSTQDAIIHASQALDQLSAALQADLLIKGKYKYASIKLLDSEGNYLAKATVEISDAISLTKGELKLKEYIERVDFYFKD